MRIVNPDGTKGVFLQDDPTGPTARERKTLTPEEIEKRTAEMNNLSVVMVQQAKAMIDAARFFKVLYAGQTGVLELRTFDHADANKLRQFLPVKNGEFDVVQVGEFLKETERREIGAFFGVALRTQSSIKDRKGDGAHCQTLTSLFVDADFKHLGEEETRKRIEAFPLPPTMIVCSGGGLHPYWVLQDPIFLQMDDGMARSRLLLRRLASKVADVVDESVSEPVRVLRIPGSFNFKKEYVTDGGARPVVLEYTYDRAGEIVDGIGPTMSALEAIR